MRYQYYKERIKSSPHSGNFLKIFLLSLILIVVVVWVIMWNQANTYEPELMSEQGFYEGYFTLNTRMDQTLTRRFPSLEFVEGRLSDDGMGTRVFKISDQKGIRSSDIKKLLESTLGGFGFQVQQTADAGDHWEFQVGSDSTVWSVYRFEYPEEKAAPTSILPADIAKVSKRPRLAIIIDDFGYSMNETINGFISLKEPFTAAVIPGRPYSTQVDERLNNRSIQTLIHMPMITVTNSTSEPDYALSDDLSDGEIVRRLKKARKDVPQATGMNNHQGSGGTQSRKVMTGVADFLAEQKMFFIDSRTIAASVGETVARERYVPTNSRDVFLDEVDDQEAIAGELFRLARIAKEQGEAIGIGHCRPNTLKTLKKYLPALAEAGFDLVPVSKLVK
ncbi:MAG: divergent polysaccharide deacetylase family protein [FCB group bacterium]|nr:divergent polysaccharide deacetylase family protein [FCB group bacterium]MBL7027247.1 divergent polysaccharide deacetylase family protein [Candidatus Neomarinimicrobiota bacterium]MBL7120518.1 divergent polysaccharide deacetylase family protein [Candidatus Neomarinimicrobiota bacterium]